MELFSPEAHEPLRSSAWSETSIRSRIDAIVSRTVDAYEPNRFWPRHPGDEYASPTDRDKGLWIGAAGVLLGLERLGAGLGEADVYNAYLADPDFAGSTGLMMGEVGVLLVSWKLAPTVAKEQRLFDLVEGNLQSASGELFNGVPGTMLAALHVFEETRSDRWRELWQRCAATVLEQFRLDPELGCFIWIQYRRGRLLRSVGAGHGFASNVRSLLRGQELLTSTQRRDLEHNATETAITLALRQGEMVNWPTAADVYWAEQFPTRVQWCHGAPGMITGLSSLPREERLDDLLQRAGDLIWDAGPLTKGPGVCHGTAGNGYALLALHERFGGPWLDRACAFGVHASAQVTRAEPRHSLWTGDIGVALYLTACLTAFTGIPSFDTL